MQCKSCSCFMDAEVYKNDNNPECMFCGGRMQYSATDYLSKPELGLISEIRPTQLALAKQLELAVSTDMHAVVEAGTGVGKSFAYLLSTIIKGKRVVISTAKKSLMSQLIEKDLPLIRKLIGPELTFAPAYGKSNYGCKKAAASAPKKEDRAIYDAFFDHAPTWRWAEAADIPAGGKGKSLPIALPRDHWRYSARECVGKECSYFRNNSCEYMRARRKIAESKVVVTNHWLLGYDIALRSDLRKTGFDTSFELLGNYHTLVIDEAHKFEEGFRTAFINRLEENLLTSAIDKYNSNMEAVGEQMASVPQEQTLVAAWHGLFRKLKTASGNDESTEVSASFLGSEGTALLNAVTATETACVSSRVLATLFGNDAPKAKEYLIRGAAVTLDPSCMDKLFIHKRLLLTLTKIKTVLEDAYSGNDNFVTYLERGDFQRRSSISVSPISMGEYLQSTYNRLESVIYISATLSVNGTFNDFERRVGLSNKRWENRIERGVYGSAFDLKKQALLYLSPNVPEPTYRADKRDHYREKLSEEVYDLVSASQGCAFVLFTSRVEMDYVYDYLIRKGVPYVLRQTPGAPASEILKRFRETTGGPVLLGLKSFWEGVDVQGNQLQLVIISKLPFPGRSDPIVSARRQREGKSWFARVDLPDMVLDLRQGVGRLIRSTNDRGVVALLDKRLSTKRYKNQVLRSLGFGSITNNKDATTRALRNLASKR